MFQLEFQITLHIPVFIHKSTFNFDPEYFCPCLFLFTYLFSLKKDAILKGTYFSSFSKQVLKSKLRKAEKQFQHFCISISRNFSCHTGKKLNCLLLCHLVIWSRESWILLSCLPFSSLQLEKERKKKTQIFRILQMLYKIPCNFHVSVLFSLIEIVFKILFSFFL